LGSKMLESLFQRYDRLLYVVRHGEAKAESEDPARPLSDAGREAVQRMARWAAIAGMPVRVIEHSGKLRAAQTAELLAERLQPSEGVHAVQGLRAHDSEAALASHLEGGPAARMLVGHLPQLERLIALLTVGAPDAALVRLDPAALAILAETADGWVLLAVLQPELVRIGE
jgi:phosphohistidine phosphatase